MPSGLTLDVLHVPASGPPTVRPELTVGGVGVRLARTSGPLLATAVTIESVALSLFADVAVPDGMVHASGRRGWNWPAWRSAWAVAATATTRWPAGCWLGAAASDQPQPRFSPALAIQKHGTDAAFVSSPRATAPGPWWVIIQRGFGPIYIEQVGLAVTMASAQTRLASGCWSTARSACSG